MSLELWILILNLLLQPAMLTLVLIWITIMVAIFCPSTRTFVLAVLRLLVEAIRAWHGGGGSNA